MTARSVNSTVSAERSASQTGTFLSLGIRMTGKRCLVVGGGRIGTRKIVALVRSGANVVVISPKVSDEVRRLAEAGDVDWRRRTFRPDDLYDLFLVVAATSDLHLNASIGRSAEQCGILACVASSAAESGILFPAVVTETQGELTIAVHTHGQDCRRSKRLRNALSKWLCSTDARVAPSASVVNAPADSQPESAVEPLVPRRQE